MNLPVFTESKLCVAGGACASCRSKDAAKWYARWASQYRFPEGWERRDGETEAEHFERLKELCPKRLPMTPPKAARVMAEKPPGPPKPAAPVQVVAAPNHRKPDRPKMRGAGDLVERATKALGIPTCGGCAKRKALLNKILPFGAAQDPPPAT